MFCLCIAERSNCYSSCFRAPMHIHLLLGFHIVLLASNAATIPLLLLCSYLLYEPLEFDPTQQYRPPTTTGGHLMPSRNAQPGHAGMPLRRVNANRPDLEKSPYKVMTKAITDAINTIKSDYGDKTTIKLFITGVECWGCLGGHACSEELMRMLWCFAASMQ